MCKTDPTCLMLGTFRLQLSNLFIVHIALLCQSGFMEVLFLHAAWLIHVHNAISQQITLHRQVENPQKKRGFYKSTSRLWGHRSFGQTFGRSKVSAQL